MEKTYSKIMMLSVAFMISMATFAETKINGVYYNLDGNKREAQVTYNESAPADSYSSSYSGAVTIPQVVTLQRECSCGFLFVFIFWSCYHSAGCNLRGKRIYCHINR